MRKEYQERRNYIVNALNSIDGVTYRMPEGAFYIFPNVSKLFRKRAGAKVIKDSIDFCSFILGEAQVALVPGGAFGADNFVRLSYATCMENLERGIERIKQVIYELE